MVQAGRKVSAKDPGEKLAHRRLTVLELAVSEFWGQTPFLGSARA